MCITVGLETISICLAAPLIRGNGSPQPCCTSWIYFCVCVSAATVIARRRALLRRALLCLLQFFPRSTPFKLWNVIHERWPPRVIWSFLIAKVCLSPVILCFSSLSNVQIRFKRKHLVPNLWIIISLKDQVPIMVLQAVCALANGAWAFRMDELFQSFAVKM